MFKSRKVSSDIIIIIHFHHIISTSMELMDYNFNTTHHATHAYNQLACTYRKQRTATCGKWRKSHMSPVAVKGGRRRRKSAKVRKVQVSKKYSLIHYRQNFYKCQCSKDVLLETNKFIQHLREGECQEHQEYNSHFLKKGRLVKNHKIDQKLLRKLYLLQNKIQKYLFICNCG